jgi:hypothetical protein
MDEAWWLSVVLKVFGLVCDMTQSVSVNLHLPLPSLNPNY